MEELNKLSQRFSLQLKALPSLIGLNPNPNPKQPESRCLSMSRPSSPLTVSTISMSLQNLSTSSSSSPSPIPPPSDHPQSEGARPVAVAMEKDVSGSAPSSLNLVSISSPNTSRKSSLRESLPDVSVLSPGESLHFPITPLTSSASSPASMTPSPTVPPRQHHHIQLDPSPDKDFAASTTSERRRSTTPPFNLFPKVTPTKEDGPSVSGNSTTPAAQDDHAPTIAVMPPSPATPTSSREGSVERSEGVLHSGRSPEEISLGSGSTRSSEEGHLPKTGSFGALNATPGGAALVAKEKKMQGLSAASVHRHNSDASSVASSQGKTKSTDKKKQRWYQSLYPTYKQRSEEFRKLFPTIPESERLLIDYSCALQRDILVQGRLYVSQHHICFYAKIIAWETTICTPWKEVKNLSKERTAKIIPNAISYHTDSEHYYFTSFSQRDKTFTNLYRIWQGVEKEQAMSPPEMWSFIHYQYGDDLGLTSDDEDYVQPAYLRSLPELIVAVNGAAAAAEAAGGTDTDHEEEPVHFDGAGAGEGEAVDGPLPLPLHKPSKMFGEKLSRQSSSESTNGSSGENAEETAEEQPIFVPPAPATGTTFIDHQFHIPFDKLFLVLFSESTLLKEMYLRRKIFETEFGHWMLDPSTDCQIRDVKYCMSIGPKTIRTEERQTLLKESVPGKLHLVDSVAQNHGAPYSDSFSVVTHFMVCKANKTDSRLRVVTEIVFRKANWAVKTLLEKGVMDQLRDYMTDLKSRLSTYEAEIATCGNGDGEAAESPGDGGSEGRLDRRKSSRHKRDGGVSLMSSGSSVVGASGSGSGSLRTRLRSTTQAPDESLLQRPGAASPSPYVTHVEYKKARNLVYLIILLLLINGLLYWRVWLAQPVTGTETGTAPLTDHVPVAPAPSLDPRLAFSNEAEWEETLRRLADSKNSHLLHTINDGLSNVLQGLHKISGALEQLHSNLATPGPVSPPPSGSGSGSQSG